ncbi:hypothetical protein, conserved [Eimeria praecox]|uniref:Uncharacterized protein n=1 Tax=Eimeria praecox TaxID=51316 RepID=U6H2R9_9EIME|nr:hypothetical protein, conserved [Eimeria praecox]
MIHMVATGIYLFGLKGTSFAVAWPQPFPAGASTAKDSWAWAVPVNSFWFRGESSQGISLGSLIVSPPTEGPTMGPSPVGNAVAKWAGLGHRLGGSSWGLLIVALSLPPLADLLCSVVGFWFFLTGDVRQEQLVCLAVAATMPKHLIVYLLILVCGASMRVAFFGVLELLFMAAIKLLLCTLASMYASRIEKPNAASPASTKESKLLASIAQGPHDFVAANNQNIRSSMQMLLVRLLKLLDKPGNQTTLRERQLNAICGISLYTVYCQKAWETERQFPLSVLTGFSSGYTAISGRQIRFLAAIS